MDSTFDPQILVERLAKLNSSQQCIETLSHWCIFHMNKAKQVVETWDRQFRCSARDQRLAFLYLANDILQNSKRKGQEFVGEFWSVLPNALQDVIDNTDESRRNAALRLVKIWEERKVFGSRGPILKEELAGRHRETGNRKEKRSGVKLQQSTENALDKIVSAYQMCNSGQHAEDAIISKCKNTIGCVKKARKEIGADFRSGKGRGSVEKIKGHTATLKDCIEQLSALDASRTNLVCHLREFLQEQEMKQDQIRKQLKAALSQSEKADNICKKLQNRGRIEQSTVVAVVAAKLTASTSSTKMLPHVISSTPSEDVTGNSVKEPSSTDYSPAKRAKIATIHDFQQPTPPDEPCYDQPPPPPDEPPCDQPPPPPSSPPPLPPMPPMQAYPEPPYIETAGQVAFPYSMTQRPPPPLQGYPVVGPPINVGVSYVRVTPPPIAYRKYYMEGGFSSKPTAPMSRP